MFTLAFDTTANFCSVALFEDLKKIECFEQEMDFGQAEKLMVEIDNMLKKHNMVFKDLSLVVVCTGPGSFTGVRSSVSAARAFKLACKDVCVAGVNAFDAYVADVTPDESAQINAVIICDKYTNILDLHSATIQRTAVAHCSLTEIQRRFIHNFLPQRHREGGTPSIDTIYLYRTAH